jgi:hypothetical protein
MICREQEGGRLHVKDMTRVCNLRRARNIVEVAFRPDEHPTMGPQDRVILTGQVYLELMMEEGEQGS